MLAWQRYRYYLNEPKINNLLGEHDSQVTVVDGRAYGLNPQYGVVYVLPIRNLGGSHVKNPRLVDISPHCLLSLINMRHAAGSMLCVRSAIGKQTCHSIHRPDFEGRAGGITRTFASVCVTVVFESCAALAPLIASSPCLACIADMSAKLTPAENQAIRERATVARARLQ